MANGYKQKGDILSYTLSGTVASGDVVSMGKLNGVALMGGVSGDVIEVSICGVWNLLKATGTAFVQGDRLYWNSSTGLTKTTTDVPIGIAASAAASGDVLADVLLYEGGSPPQSTAIADISTADATDLPSVLTLANAIKAKINADLAARRVAGMLDA